MRNKWSRWGLGLLAVSLLSAAYLFQRYDVAGVLGIGIGQGNTKFVVNKSVRFLMNESACLLLIVSVFNDKKFVQIGFMLFLAELIFLLPLYFVLKLSWEGDSEISSPLLSQIHRMVVNPLLMLVLIMGMSYQHFVLRKA